MKMIDVYILITLVVWNIIISEWSILTGSAIFYSYCYSAALSAKIPLVPIIDSSLSLL